MSKNFFLSMMLCLGMLSVWADDNGTTGDCTWYFEEATGTLTISGTGSTDSYNPIWFPESIPWGEYLDQIQKVIVEEGVTQIGYGNLVKTPNLKTVELASTVKTINDYRWNEYYYTFFGCNSLETVYLHGCVINFDIEKCLPQGATVVWEEGSGYTFAYLGLDDDYLNTYENPLDKDFLSTNNRQIRIPICIKHSFDISQIQFDISFDEGGSFSLAEDDNGRKMVEMDKNRFDYDPDFGYSHTMTLGDYTPYGFYRVILTNSDNTPIVGNDGVIVYVTICVNENAIEGNYDDEWSKLIRVSNIELSSPTADRYLPVDIQKGVKLYLRDSGDFNGDEDVTVTDYAGVVKYIAGQVWNEDGTTIWNTLGVPEWVIKKASDVNEDGEVTVTDISGIVNIILYGNYKGNTSNAKARRAAKSSGAMLNIEPFSINRGETKEITVDLSSAYADLSQCQFDLNLPEGLSLASVNGRMAVYPGDLTRLADGYSHTVSSAQREDGTVRVVCLSGSNEAYNGTEGSIVRMKVMADKNVAVGTADIELTNVEFARTDASMVLGAGSIAAVTVGSETNGITSVADSSVASKEFYSADGIHKDRLTKGLNIVRHADGRIQKIMVK